MKAISKQLQNSLPKDILTARITKDITARDELARLVGAGEYSPTGTSILCDDDPSQWVSASILTDASIHRMAYKVVTDGTANLQAQIAEMQSSLTYEFIRSLLAVGGRVGHILRNAVGSALESKNYDRKSALSDLMSGADNSSYLTEIIIKIWSKTVTPYDSRSWRNHGGNLVLSKEGGKVLSPEFRDSIEYAVDGITGIVERMAPESGLSFSSIYSTTSVEGCVKHLDALNHLGLAGIFQQLYGATKGYTHPLCRACLYSPKTKTFWYALRPITLTHGPESDDVGDVSHTFTGLWIRWSPKIFTDSITTYSENAVQIVRVGDITHEAPSPAFFHPHVGETGNLCFGGAGCMFKLASDAFSLSAAIDIVIGVLNEYAGGDAYTPLKKFTMTTGEWNELHDSSDENCCEECGDEVDTDDDIYCDCTDVWYHQGCCTYSEWTGEYLASSNATYSDLLDCFICSQESVCLLNVSKESGWVPMRHDDIRQLWIPESIDDYVNKSGDLSGTTWSYKDITNENHIGIIGFIHCTDVEDLDDTTDEGDAPEYVPLSTRIYRTVFDSTRNSTPHTGFVGPNNLWARSEDCVQVLLNDEAPYTENSKLHYVLEMHVTTSPIVSRNLNTRELDFSIQSITPTETKENKETK